MWSISSECVKIITVTLTLTLHALVVVSESYTGNYMIRVLYCLNANLEFASRECLQGRN